MMLMPDQFGGELAMMIPLDEICLDAEKLTWNDGRIFIYQ
jgi:hypothetical protein